MRRYRIRKEYRTKVRLSCLGCLTFIVVIITAVCRCTCTSCSSDKDVKNSVRAAKHLNDTLCNALSDLPEFHKMDSVVERYLKRWEINGAQLAISRNDSLLYAKGFGFADKDNGVRMEAGHIMRIASVSKLLTAVGIMKLREEGKLRLSDKVFGPDGILNDSIFTNAIKDKLYFDITVEHLLRHQAGFTKQDGDPMFSTRYIMMQNSLSTPPDYKTLLSIVLKRRLRYAPGTSQFYCNIGYMLLSKIIERRSGMDYEEFMRKKILEPAGCFDMHIAGNYLSDRRDNETVYYMHSGSEPVYEFNNSGRLVEKCYGENNLPELTGAGAWCSSAAELCRFVASIDGGGVMQDVLSPESVSMMTREMPDHAYSLGWNFTPANSHWERSGTLSGTSALVIHYNDGECWVFITNTSIWKGHVFSKDTKALFDKLRKDYGATFPKRNLFV